MKTIFFLLVLSQSVWAYSNQSIQKLNQKIFETGADWVAGETSVSSLSLSEMQQLLDKNLDPHPGITFETPEGVQGYAAVTAWDWRNKDGKNWLNPIRSQELCGSCLAFAATSAMETVFKIASGSANTKIKLSPQFAFSCGGGLCKVGWYQDQAAQFLKNTGVTDESCMPYASSRGNDVSCGKACSNAAQKTKRIASYSRPTKSSRNLDAIRTALQKGPLVTSMTAYNDFRMYRRGIYKHVSGASLGGHAIVIVGYNDKERYLIIRNSWGTSWGESGYGRISYDDVSGIGQNTWKYEAPSAASALFPGLAQMETSSEVRRHIASTDFSDTRLDLNLSRDNQAKDQAQTAIVQLSLESLELEGFEELNLVKVRRGLPEAKIPVDGQGSRLQVKINTETLAKGEWDFYFEGRQAGFDQLVTSQKVTLTIK